MKNDKIRFYNMYIFIAPINSIHLAQETDISPTCHVLRSNIHCSLLACDAHRQWSNLHLCARDLVSPHLIRYRRFFLFLLSYFQSREPPNRRHSRCSIPFACIHHFRSSARRYLSNANAGSCRCRKCKDFPRNYRSSAYFPSIHHRFCRPTNRPPAIYRSQNSPALSIYSRVLCYYRDMDSLDHNLAWS